MMKLVYFLLIFFTFSTYAQLNSSAYQLDDINFESNFPSDIVDEGPDEFKNVTTLEEVNYLQVGSIEDSLKISPSATTTRGPRATAESIQVRGIDSKKIFIYVDGVRQNFSAGHSTFTAFDTENLKSVIVNKNSSDLSKGNSIGGGVEFKTIDPQDIISPNNQFGTQVKTSSSSASSERVYNLKQAYKDKNRSALVSVSNKSASDLILNNGETLNNSSFKEDNLLVKFGLGKLKLSYEQFEREDKSPLDPTLNPPDRLESLLGINIYKNKNIKVAFDDNGTSLNTYLNQQESIQNRKSDNIKQYRIIETLGLNLKKNINKFRFGGHLYTDRLSSSESGKTINSYPEAFGINSSAFLEYHYELKALKVSPGLKLTQYEINANAENVKKKRGSKLLKKLTTSYSLSDELKVYSSFSEGYNAPKVQNTYPQGLHSRGDDFFIQDNFFIPNPKLEAESSEQLEVGFSLLKPVGEEGLLELSASAYENRVKNYILMERIDRSVFDEEPGTTQFINIDNVFLEGHEYTLRYFNSHFDAKLTLSQVRGRNEDLDLYLEDLPADTYQLDLRYLFHGPQIRIGYLGTQTLNQERVNPQTIQRTDPTDGAYTHSIWGQKDFPFGLSLNARIDNWGNKKYRRHASHLYEAQEDIKLAIKYTIQ